ncbi:MAG TPA: GyrI-like domain-containing protein [Myxococcota bacterium]|nr:GyrI-like domain-containing protein [Myxococcota bacterium]
MIAPPEVVDVPRQLTAVIPIVVPRSGIREVMGPAIQELIGAVVAQGVGPTGPWYGYHRRMDPDVFDFEVGVPTSAPVSPVGRVIPGALPAARVARTIYSGSYEGLHEAWSELVAWVEAQGLTPAPDLWERYVVGPESGPGPWQTELNRVVVR